ncbi:MAG: hypothetical protein ABJC79_13135 [Acidimicrobiia bacterium]
MKFNLNARQRQAVIDQAIKDNRWQRRYHVLLADLKIELSWIGRGLSSLKDGDKWRRRHQAFTVFYAEEMESIREDLSAPKYRYDQFRRWYKNRG